MNTQNGKISPVNTLNGEVRMEKNMPKISNSGWKRRIGLVLIFAAVLTIFMVHGWGGPNEAQADTHYSRANTAWSTGTTWSTTACGGTSAGAAPVAGDSVVICTGNTVTLTAAPANVLDLTIQTGATLAGAGFVQTITGNYTNNGTHTSTFATTGSDWFNMTGANAVLDGSGTITNSSGTPGRFTLTSTANGKSFAATANLTFNTPLYLNGAFTVNNNGRVTVANAAVAGGLNGSAAGAAWANLAGSTLNYSNTATALMGTGTLTATAATNTVNYSGAGAQTGKVTTYNNLTISGSGIKTFNTTPTVNNVLSMEGTATIVATTGVVTYGANATLQYNTATARTATAEEWITPFAATGGVVIANTGTITMNAAKVFNNSIPLTINTGATLATNNLQLTLGGNFVNNGTLTAGTSNIVIGTGTAAQSISGFTTTGTVSMTKTGGTATFTANVNGGAFTLNGLGGTLDLGVGLTHTFTGNWTRSNGALLGNSSTLNIGGTTTNTAGTFTAGAGTVNYTGAAQTIANVIYNNLTLSGSGAKTMTGVNTINGNLTLSGTASATLTAATTVGGNVDIGAGTTLNTGNFALGVKGNWTNTGTFTPGIATVTFNGTGNQTINSSNTWYGLSVTAASARTVYFASGSTQTIAAGGSLNFQGAAGQLLTLAPSVAATPWLLNKNAAITPTISYVSVSYSDASSGGVIDISASANGNVNGGFNTNWLFYCLAGAPSALNAGTVTTTSVALSWTTGANNNSFNVYRDGVKISTDGAVTTPAFTDTTATPSKTYSYTVKGYYSAGSCESNASSNTLTKSTLAVTPGAPVVQIVNTSTLSVAVGTDANSAEATYAIRINGGGYTNQFVQPGGTIGASAAWQTKAAWGTTNIGGLTLNTTYTFDVEARNGNGENVISSPAFGPTTAVTLHAPSTITSCSGCHAYPPKDGTRSGATGSVLGSHQPHDKKPAYICNVCHVAPGGETSAFYGHRDRYITMQTLIQGGTYTRGTSFLQTNNPTTTGCSNTACHGGNNPTPAWGGATPQCIQCHNGVVSALNASAASGGAVTQRDNVVAEFRLTWGHKSGANGTKTDRGAVTDSDCIVCHLEGNFTTQKPSSYHADGYIDLRDPDVQGETRITDISGSSFRFVKFLTSYATRTSTGHLSNDIDNVLTQKFCLKCHDSNGAANTTARSTYGTPSQWMPFGGVNLGANYTVANGSAQAGGIVNVNNEFATTNTSYHPVRGPLNRDYPWSTRLAAPYNNIGIARDSNTGATHVMANSVVINCFDCHTTGTSLTNRTIVAHGNAVTLRGTIYTTTPNLCQICHTGYTNAGQHSAGSAMQTNGNGGAGDEDMSTLCHKCHSSATTKPSRPIPAQDYHGNSNLVGGGVWSGSGALNGNVYAFIRNTTTFIGHRPLYRSPQWTTGSATCQGDGTHCAANNGTQPYTPGGTY